MNDDDVEKLKMNERMEIDLIEYRYKKSKNKHVFIRVLSMVFSKSIDKKTIDSEKFSSNFAGFNVEVSNYG